MHKTRNKHPKKLQLNKIIRKYSMGSVGEIRSLRKVRKYASQLNEYIWQQEKIIKQLKEALEIDQFQINEELFQESCNELSAQEKMVKMRVKERFAELMREADVVDSVFSNNEIG